MTQRYKKRRKRRRLTSTIGKDRRVGAVSKPDAVITPNDASPSAIENYKPISEQFLLQERSILSTISHQTALQHGKTVITIATGGLALSLVFLKDIAPRPESSTLPLLGVSWLLFVATVMIVLAAFWTSQQACREQSDFLNQYYFENKAVLQSGRWSTNTAALNFFAYLTLLAAVATFCFFAWVNVKYTLGKEYHVSNERQDHSRPQSPSGQRTTVPLRLPEVVTKPINNASQSSAEQGPKQQK